MSPESYAIVLRRPRKGKNVAEAHENRLTEERLKRKLNGENMRGFIEYADRRSV
jgi:hypothetical protein